jgi:uncharacterized membrane protein YdjX (TVP38/TMEM64 family)
MSDTGYEKKTSGLSNIFSAIVLLLIFGMALIYMGTNYEDLISPDSVMAWLDDVGPLAPILYMLVMAAAIVISPIPSLPLVMMAGAYFGPWLATMYSAIGALAGANISFLIARFLGRSLVERFIKLDRVFWELCSETVLVKIVFVSRLIPFISFDVISYGAGLTRMSLWKFTIATFFGMLPMTFLFAYYGSIITINSTLTYVLGIIMVLVFLLLPKWLEKSSFKDKLLMQENKRLKTVQDQNTKEKNKDE